MLDAEDRGFLALEALIWPGIPLAVGIGGSAIVGLLLWMYPL